jgi:hypothetical protein
LPDGIFSYQTKNPISVHFIGPLNEKCWYILWSLGIFTAVWYILIGTYIFGHLVYFSRFGLLYHEQSVNPARDDNVTIISHMVVD